MRWNSFSIFRPAVYQLDGNRKSFIMEYKQNVFFYRLSGSDGYYRLFSCFLGSKRGTYF